MKARPASVCQHLAKRNIMPEMGLGKTLEWAVS